MERVRLRGFLAFCLEYQQPSFLLILKTCFEPTTILFMAGCELWMSLTWLVQKTDFLARNLAFTFKTLCNLQRSLETHVAYTPPFTPQYVLIGLQWHSTIQNSTINVRIYILCVDKLINKKYIFEIKLYFNFLLFNY